MMGVDLRIIPVEHEGEAMWLGHSLLECDRRSDLWQAIYSIQRQHGAHIPDGVAFHTFSGRLKSGELGYADTQKTPYGERILFVTAGEIAALADHPAVTKEKQNRAAWAYLSALPPGTKVALYWH